ncbi:MAG TPA: hypothetical protein VH120_03600, partial [Gemmataceae bacterium]|nr:hypothetical protein [Gemmataceae bacterium]
MRNCVVVWLAGLSLGLNPTANAAPVPAGGALAFKPTVTVRVAPPDKLLDDIRYTATLFSRLAPTDKEARDFTFATDMAVTAALGPDWRKAIDSARPLLAYAMIDADVPSSAGAVLIPVKDEGEFRKILTRLVGKLDAANDGLLRFNLPSRGADGKPLVGYLRFARQHAYLTVHNAEALALNRIPTPEQIVAGDSAAAASFRVYLDRMPQQFRQAAVNGLDQFKSVVRGEQANWIPISAGLAELVVLGPMLELYPLAEPAIRDGQELAVDLRYNRKQLNLSLDLTLTAKPGSDLAKATQAIRPITSLFPQFFGPETAGRALARCTVPEDLRKAFLPHLEAALTQLPDSVPVWGKFAARIAESVMPTLREGEIDAAAGLRGPYPGDSYGIFGGLRLKDAPAVEKAFRSAVSELPKDARDLFVLDSGTIGETKFHTVKLPPLPDPAKSLFAETGLLVAFRPDGVIFGFGKSAMVSLHEGLGLKPQPVPLTFVEAYGKRLVPLVMKINPD